MAKKLTALAVENAKAGSKRIEVPDAALPGLYLVVQPTGAKSWAYRYRFDGKTKKHTVGAFPAIELAAARELAQAAARAVAEGRDPSEEKKAARRKSGDTPQTIDELAEKFITRYARRHTRETTWRETARILGLKVDPNDADALIPSENGGEVLAKWKGRSIEQIKRAHVIELLDAIVDRGSPITANRVLAVLRKMFAWATSRDIIEVSPCAGVKKPSAEVARDRVLSDDELRAIWAACNEIDWPFGHMVKMLMLTAQRRDEVAAGRWSEFDMEAKTWTLARARVKNNIEHAVPLSDEAIAVIETVKRIDGKKGFVFTTTGETHVVGFSRAKERLDNAIHQITGKTPPHWTFHDLRRTAATGMARLGINLPVIEKVLNHTGGSFGGIVGIYQRHDFNDEKRKALAAWGNYIETLVTGAPPSNVVRLSSARAI
jgi:integrase